MRFTYVLLKILTIVCFSSSATAIERDLFAFQNGVHFKTTEERIKVLKELGYHGIGSARPDDLTNRLNLYSTSGLKIYSIYVGTKLNSGGTQVPEKIKKAIAALKGSGAFVELYVQGNTKQQTDEDAVAFVRNVADLAKESRLKVVLYPHANFYIDTLSDAARIAKLVDRPNVGAMFNLCHFLKVEPKSNLEEELTKAKPYLWRVSLNGAETGGTNWQQLIQPLGKGSYDVNNVLHLLDKLEFKGAVGIQCYNIKGDARTNLQQTIDAWRQMHGEEAPSEGAQNAVKDFRTRLVKINTKPVSVSTEIFALCRGLTNEELAGMRQSGTGPHFLTSINVYANELAKPEFDKQKPEKFAVGSVIIKEKAETHSYGFNFPGVSGKKGIGGMIKREPGYDSDNGDWEYFYQDEAGRLVSGKMKNCITCHSGTKQSDYVFGSWKNRSSLPGF